MPWIIALDLLTVAPFVGAVISMLMGATTVMVILASAWFPTPSMALAARMCNPGGSPEVWTEKLKGGWFKVVYCDPLKVGESKVLLGRPLIVCYGLWVFGLSLILTGIVVAIAPPLSNCLPTVT